MSNPSLAMKCRRVCSAKLAAPVGAAIARPANHWLRHPSGTATNSASPSDVGPLAKHQSRKWRLDSTIASSCKIQRKDPPEQIASGCRLRASDFDNRVAESPPPTGPSHALGGQWLRSQLASLIRQQLLHLMRALACETLLPQSRRLPTHQLNCINFEVAHLVDLPFLRTPVATEVPSKGCEGLAVNARDWDGTRLSPQRRRWRPVQHTRPDRPGGPLQELWAGRRRHEERRHTKRRLGFRTYSVTNRPLRNYPGGSCNACISWSCVVSNLARHLPERCWIETGALATAGRRRRRRQGRTQTLHLLEGGVAPELGGQEVGRSAPAALSSPMRAGGGRHAASWLARPAVNAELRVVPAEDRQRVLHTGGLPQSSYTARGATNPNNALERQSGSRLDAGRLLAQTHHANRIRVAVETFAPQTLGSGWCFGKRIPVRTVWPATTLHGQEAKQVHILRAPAQLIDANVPSGHG